MSPTTKSTGPSTPNWRAWAATDRARMLAGGTENLGWVEEQLGFAFHKGQLRAWESAKRFPLVLAGTQSGKTAFGPVWLYREIERRGHGDYLVVTPTYPLLKLKALTDF